MGPQAGEAIVAADAQRLRRLTVRRRRLTVLLLLALLLLLLLRVMLVVAPLGSPAVGPCNVMSKRS